MSGGQQQRVALARALVIKPSILLLDEPLSNLDAKLREEMQAELRAIQRSLGTTTILVTHDQSEAMALSDRIVIMNKGRVEQIARPEEAYARPASAFVASFLGKTNSFAATVSSEAGGMHARIGDLVLPVGGQAAIGPNVVTVRPERIGFLAEGGVPARVRARVFQGAHWLFQLDTDGGPVSVIRQNDGTAQPQEGEAVRLGWGAGDMLVQLQADTP
jgi:putative spermidine/putrescine transport system ATP-binding protein